MTDTPTVLECDLLVIGGGMAGLSAAGWAAERGARVVVVERAADIGGSAFLSGGVLWTATSPGRMRLYAGGDEALAAVILSTYPTAVEWMRKREIAISPAMPVLHGRGYQIDIIAHLRGCASMVERAAGMIALETETVALVIDDEGVVAGADTAHRDGSVRILAPHTILATGGYQGSPEKRAERIHPNAREMRLRANPFSNGRGIELGQEAGGAIDTGNRGFYGHLVSDSREWGLERHFTGLSQYHSEYSLLLNEAGHRFCDETMGDHCNSYHTVMQHNARALCFWDARIHAEHATRPVVATAPPLDKMALAIESGGQGIVAQQLDDVARFADRHGFDGRQVKATIEDYNAKARTAWERLSPGRADHCQPIDEAPFYALIVYPAITFTFGGLRVNGAAQVLREDGAPVPGLLAAGSDAGSAFGIGYAGGLALAMTFGIVAAQTAGWR